MTRPTLALLAALLFLSGCHHHHSDTQPTPEPQTAPYLPPHVIPPCAVPPLVTDYPEDLGLPPILPTANG